MNYMTVVLLFCTILLLFFWYRFHLSQRKNCYMLIDSFSDTILFQYDIRHDRLSFSSNAVQMLNLKTCVQADFLQHFPYPYIHPEDQKLFKQLLILSSRQENVCRQVRFIRPDGSCFWCLVKVMLPLQKVTKQTVIGKITDIEDVIRRENYLVKVAEMDGLSGLYNRTASEEHISALIGKHRSGIFFTIDIDDFKQINDQNGHAVGDKVIQFIATSMRTVFQKDSILGRTGGDEFIIFSPGACSPDTAENQIAALTDHLKKAPQINLPELSISTGIAIFPIDGTTYQELYHVADNAMYAAKRSGKSQVCFYQEIS